MNYHIGRNICRIRELRGMKQGALAADLGVSQQAVSKLEQNEILDNETLERVAQILGVTTEGIRNFKEDNIFGSINNTESYSGHTEKVIELYERLLTCEREKAELLKQQK